MEKVISVVIKVTNACNLKCRYCYDANERKKCFVTKEQITKLFDILTKSYERINVIWHGGEPMLMGIDFYKWVVELQKSYTNNTFDNKMQSNAVLMNDEWAKFFVDNNFKVGVSYDGGDEETGREKQKETLDGRALIIKYGGRCGIVNVVNAYNIDKLEELYERYKKENINVNFNCVFPSGRITENENNDLLITTNQFIEKIKVLFDKWILDEDCHINISPLDSYLNKYIGKGGKCTTQGCMFKWLCMDSNGDLYPCGRIIMEDYNFGNIKDISSIDDVFSHPNYEKLLRGAIDRRNKCMKECSIYNYCHGGCNSDAILYGNIDENNHHICVVNKVMFAYSSKIFNEILSGTRECKNKHILNTLEQYSKLIKKERSYENE